MKFVVFRRDFDQHFPKFREISYQFAFVGQISLLYYEKSLHPKVVTSDVSITCKKSTSASHQTSKASGFHILSPGCSWRHRPDAPALLHSPRGCEAHGLPGESPFRKSERAKPRIPSIWKCCLRPADPRHRGGPMQDKDDFVGFFFTKTNFVNWNAHTDRSDILVELCTIQTSRLHVAFG